MKVTKRIGYTAATVVAAAALIGGGAAVASAASTPSPSATSSSGSGTHARGQHTAASADETAKVTAAIKSKDANANVTKVEKDADGSFDAMATSNGSTVRYEVSADYKTVTQAAAHRMGGHGMGGQRTPLTSDELSKVTAAIKAKDANATVKDSWKDSDGSFDVVATSGSTTTKYEVSADYKTVTADANFGHGGQGGHRMHDGAGSGSASGSASGGTTQG
ncbi:hypothetical protein SCMU_40190 [Sinomonas cyclohexanicum]|uniref:PepSY domain-containing protein n=1 Tax=Sinomonas cyclohexanicum TaxID=322009 RepID=A0ABM7Q0T4_SINCY|nr:hypothetical protein [Corynebacterium cyclohexanicum]BCT78177.1 hypothetical protein SCMU_40190 [Corynebacterium cyclohexanicum]